MPTLNRRTFLRLSAAGAASLTVARATTAVGQSKPQATYVYKTVGDCRIKADVYGASAGGGARPVLVWIHGGALIMGSRAGIDRGLVDALVKAGYVVVSIDYRLAPETKLPAILDDVQDAFRWVREKGPELFNAAPDRLAVAGASAGGYLTLVTGYKVDPRPKVLVSYWGYGDIAGAWYSRPDPFYLRSPIVPEKEARGAVGSAVVSEGVGRNNRGRFYLYCRQQGLWPKEVAGRDPDTEPKAFDPFCPIRNVTATYPPTMFVHGTKDTDVPYEQSESMAHELADKGVENVLIRVPDGGHGLPGTNPAVITGIRDRVVAFVDDHVRGR
jgi:acetyl esterase/lipase